MKRKKTENKKKNRGKQKQKNGKKSEPEKNNKGKNIETEENGKKRGKNRKRHRFGDPFCENPISGRWLGGPKRVPKQTGTNMPILQ